MASLNFKNAALAVAVGAAALTGGLATRAKADEPAITLQTDCQAYKPGVFGASAQCQKEKLRLSKIERENSAKRLASSGDRLQTAKDEGRCLKAIEADLLSGGEKTSKLTEVPQRGDACRVASDLGLRV